MGLGETREACLGKEKLPNTKIQRHVRSVLGDDKDGRWWATDGPMFHVSAVSLLFSFLLFFF